MKNIAHSNFARLIGTWKTTGTIKSPEGELTLNGIDSYELILNDNYILHKADVKMGDEQSETLEIIKVGASLDRATMQYFNAKGEEGKMLSTIIGNEFTIEGDGLRFVGTINEENNNIKGKWYTKVNGDWDDFIDLNLQK